MLLDTIDGNIIDIGSPEQKEEEWLNAETEFEDIGDGEVQKNYINLKDGNKICNEDGLTEMLLEELMLQYLSVSTEDIYEEATERHYYKVTPGL